MPGSVADALMPRNTASASMAARSACTAAGPPPARPPSAPSRAGTADPASARPRARARPELRQPRPLLRRDHRVEGRRVDRARRHRLRLGRRRQAERGRQVRRHHLALQRLDRRRRPRRQRVGARIDTSPERSASGLNSRSARPESMEGIGLMTATGLLSEASHYNDGPARITTILGISWCFRLFHGASHLEHRAEFCGSPAATRRAARRRG